MGDFYKDLERYFRNTSPEQVKKDWEKSEEWDKVGPPVSKFLRGFPLTSNKYRGIITIEHIKAAVEYVYRSNTCTKCNNVNTEVYNCERCDELICNDCQATYNQFSKIDYNCCNDCANEN